MEEKLIAPPNRRFSHKRPSSQRKMKGSASGPEGLARVKDYDRRFAFYPSFSVERSLALEFRAQRISKLTMEIKALKEELKPENLSTIRVQCDNLQFLRYEDADLSWVVGVLLLVRICVFLALPMALLSYFDSNSGFRMALVLVMCFLISVFARFIEADEARQVVFVCVYSAVMSGFLSQIP
ncbi:uncharacterized protein LA080_008053 [Diaporthe eres]|nr:uncharacterized protein LA080_008053 [Diaporthe eres]